MQREGRHEENDILHFACRLRWAARLGAANQVQMPAGAQVVNASGKWIIPGLWDCQQNFSWFYSEPQLNQGVTSGCDIGNGDEWGIVHRDAVNHGKIRGPRVWVGVGHMGGVDPEELTGW